MLKISAQHSVIARRYGPEETIKILAEGGFDALDFSLTSYVYQREEGFLTDVNDPQFKAHFQSIGQCPRANHKVPNACSTGEDLAALIDRLNAKHGPCFAACLDVGRSLLEIQ